MDVSKWGSNFANFQEDDTPFVKIRKIRVPFPKIRVICGKIIQNEAYQTYGFSQTCAR
jgi:hypothetical protein